VTQYMAVTVGLRGNAATALRFIFAVLPNVLNVKGKGHQNVPVLFFPHIAQFSAMRFPTACKRPLIFPVQLGGLARASSGAWRGDTKAVCKSLPSEWSIQSAFCCSVHWGCLPQADCRRYFCGWGAFVSAIGRAP